MDNLPDQIQIIEDMVYSRSDESEATLDIYYKTDLRDEIKPVIIMLHGGGLFVGDGKLEKEFSTALSQNGFLVYTPSYRLNRETDALGQIRDICCVLKYVEETAGIYKGDVGNVSVIGESAGAYLAVYAAALQKSDALLEEIKGIRVTYGIKALVSFSGMFYTNRNDLIGLVYPRKIYGKRRKDKTFMELMNPEGKEVLGNLPPMLLVSSEGDFLKKYTFDYFHALEGQGRICKLIFFEDRKLKHAFPAIHPDKPESGEVIKKVCEWCK